MTLVGAMGWPTPDSQRIGLIFGTMYTQEATPVEEVAGGGVVIGKGDPYFVAQVTTSYALGTGPSRIRLYDMGPQAGPPDTPRLVAELTTSSDGGPQSLEQQLTVVSSGATTNQILDSARMYEARIIQDVTTAGDTVFVSAAIEVR